MADVCPNCGEAGAQTIVDCGQCLYCGKRWDLASGEFLPEPPVTPGGGVSVGMTTTGNFGSGKAVEAEVGLDSLTKAELQAELDRKGIEYLSSATKSELIELLQ